MSESRTTWQTRDVPLRAKQMQDLRDEWRRRVTQRRASYLPLALADSLLKPPLITIPVARRILQVTCSAAQANIKKLISVGTSCSKWDSPLATKSVLLSAFWRPLRKAICNGVIVGVARAQSAGTKPYLHVYIQGRLWPEVDAERGTRTGLRRAVRGGTRGGERCVSSSHTHIGPTRRARALGWDDLKLTIAFYGDVGRRCFGS